MTYRIHTGDPAVQFGTCADIDDALGYEHTEDEADDLCLVLNDLGNLEAWVIPGTPESWVALGEAIIAGARAKRTAPTNADLSDETRTNTETGETADGEAACGAGARNLVSFSEADAAKVLDRPITQAEYRRLVKALPFSSMGEAFAEVVYSVCADS